MIIFISATLSCSSPAENNDQQEIKSTVRNTIPEANIRFPVYYSINSGETWTPGSSGLPNEIEGSFLREFGVELILATDNLGLFMTTSNKSEWVAIGESLPGKKINALHVYNGAIYVGVYGHGVYVSTDSGQLWSNINHNLPDRRIQALYVSDQVMLAGTDTGLFSFNKTDKKWELIYGNVQVVSISQTGNVFAAGTNQGTIISTDDGSTWEWTHRAGAVHYTYFVGNQLFEFNINSNLYFSNDMGNTWNEANYAPKTGSYVYALCNAGNHLILSNNYGIHRSMDGGENWKLVYPEERYGMFDLINIDEVIYGTSRTWLERRGNQ